MSLIPGTTSVLARAAGEKACALVFLARVLPESRTIFHRAHADRIAAVLAQFRSEGWLVSLRQMLGGAADAPEVFDTSFAHGVDLVGVFEAPGIEAALEGSVRLERAGWTRRFTTEWIVGPRELANVEGIGGPIDRPWGFVAFWEWNDARTAATPDERRRNDADCDVAFQADLDANINMSGRHRSDWMHAWQHLSVWEAASPELIDRAMYLHERVRDFRFTTSRHYLGRRRPLVDFLTSEAPR